MGSSTVDATLLENQAQGVLTLNRPDKRNAIDPELREALALSDDAPVAVAHVRAERMLARAPLSFGAAKRLLSIVAESLAQTALLQSDDHREGLAAARERRDPEFRGA